MVPVMVEIILEQFLDVIAACILACMRVIRFKNTQRSWYRLSSRTCTVSKREGLVKDAVSLRQITSEGIGVNAASKDGPEALFGKDLLSLQSPPAKPAKVPETELDHTQIARTDDYSQWP